MEANSLHRGRFFPTPKRKKRIFEENPQMHALFLREVVSLLMPEATFWSRFGIALAHWRGEARIEAKRAAGGRKCSGQQIIENRVSRRMPALYQWKVGTEVAWVPQGLLDLLETLRVHPELKDVDDRPPNWILIIYL